MNENNELNDIILNKNGSANSNKKIILAVATLGVILIIVVMLMNSLSSSGIDNLPKASLPPQPQTELLTETTTQEPLFEDVEVEQETNAPDENLEQIAQKLKEESGSDEEVEVPVPAAAAPEAKKVQKPAQMPKQAVKQPVKQTVQKPLQQTSNVAIPAFPDTVKKTASKPTQPMQPAKVQQATGSGYYIQVGSFSKYEPNKNFLNSITSLGYNYEYLKADKINKVLVGPFKSEQAAKEARRVLRAKVEPGAFLLQL
jgi:DedD protein